MTRRRFYAPPSAFSADAKSATLGPGRDTTPARCLRLHPGDEIYVFDGAGREFSCAVEIIAKDSTELRVISSRTHSSGIAAAPNPAIALLKGEKFDLVIQKSYRAGR